MRFFLLFFLSFFQNAIFPLSSKLRCYDVITLLCSQPTYLPPRCSEKWECLLRCLWEHSRRSFGIFRLLVWHWWYLKLWCQSTAFLRQDLLFLGCCSMKAHESPLRHKSRDQKDAEPSSCKNLCRNLWYLLQKSEKWERVIFTTPKFYHL